MAISYAAKAGYTVVAISRGTSKKDFCLELGVSATTKTRAKIEVAFLTDFLSG